MLPEQIEAKVINQKIPVDVQFELTWRCNQKCIHCYQYPPDQSELTTNEVKDVILQLKEAGTLYLSFTGGEPLLRDDFFEIAEYAYKNHFAMLLQTNALLIDEEIADKIAGLNFFSVHISILGASPEVHDKITRVSGSYRKVLSAVELLKKKGVKVVLNMTLLKQNYSDYPEIKKLKDSLGEDVAIRISPYVFCCNNGDNLPAGMRLDDSQMKDFFIRQKMEGGGPIYNKAQLCNFGYCVCLINARGEVCPCVTVPAAAGDLKKQSFKEVWGKSRILNLIRSTKPEDLLECAECALAEWCFRCSGFSYLENCDIFGCAEEIKRIARIIKEVTQNEKTKV